ncbi:hypothetical protein HK405_006855 [Cladochytrium tenue]|nr:hypothetical protein HK405_006855 [Cladochytrium tenue]
MTAAFIARTGLADALFTTDTIAAFGSVSLPGLSLTILLARLGLSIKCPASASWSWSADPNQVAVMQAAVNHDSAAVELFSNSTRWWMGYNHSGSGFGDLDNLQS